MLFSFILFFIIGFIPFVAAYFGLEITTQQTKKLLPSSLVYFSLFSIFKLFTVSALLTELQGHNIQTFIVTLVINSFEFVAFRSAYETNKVTNAEKGNTIAFWWAFLSAFLTTILSFISNSRTYEMEPHHISYAVSTLSYLFLMFAMQNFVLSIKKFTKIHQLTASQQLFVLLLGLPSALASIEPKGLFPSFVPDLLKIGSAALLWVVSKTIRNQKEEN
ncbi:hypothetical protein TRFO_20458 [Tritrichomonas foetus]|uniref:Uncharacterized protein n=1 Tax=Tritrichomonas foetus TaxID=1144522 RepID=A0A1J4KGH8_9EUKA|nr:hypothetical protein TRFO_20458 [Tritrichomonas foetus]|eukprot:OHT10323.1 hypothetical protein TRFO_20458 [Tritrichomonas foetus]